MRLSDSFVRRGLVGVSAVGVLGAAVMVVSPAVGADPTSCTAAGLSSTVSGVTGQAAQFLEANPDANDALTQAGSQPPEEAKASLRSYFFAHADQYFQLQTIAQPLTDLRTQCNSDISVGQVATLLDALSE